MLKRLPGRGVGCAKNGRGHQRLKHSLTVELTLRQSCLCLTQALYPEAGGGR